jgi:hypothetical protein
MSCIVQVAGRYHRHLLAYVEVLLMALQVDFVFGLDAFVASAPAHLHHAGKRDFQVGSLDLQIKLVFECSSGLGHRRDSVLHLIFNDNINWDQYKWFRNCN